MNWSKISLFEDISDIVFSIDVGSCLSILRMVGMFIDAIELAIPFLLWFMKITV